MKLLIVYFAGISVLFITGFIIIKSGFFRKILLFTFLIASLFTLSLVMADYPVIQYLLLSANFFLLAGFIFINLRKKSNDLKMLVKGFEDFSLGNFKNSLKIKSSSEFQTLGRLYLLTSVNLTSIFTNILQYSEQIESISKNITHLIEDIQNAIRNQSGFSQSLEEILHTQELSIEEGSNRLNESRQVYSKISQDLNDLFNQINSLFEENQTSQKESLMMTKKSEEAMNIAADLKTVTANGTEKIEKITQFISHLDKRLKEIQGMIKMINKITHETNLLALNASIEAAHAGEYGRGFLVVADEIRQLADSSKETIHSITSMIQTILQEMNTGIEYSNDARTGIQDINRQIEKTLSVIESLNQSIKLQQSTTDKSKIIIEHIHENSRSIKDSSDYQKNKADEIYRSTDNLNSQAIIINSVIEEQKEQINSLNGMIKELSSLLNHSNLNYPVQDLIKKIR